MMFISTWLFYCILSNIRFTTSVDKIYKEFGIQGILLIWVTYMLAIAYIVNIESLFYWIRNMKGLESKAPNIDFDSSNPTDKEPEIIPTEISMQKKPAINTL